MDYIISKEYVGKDVELPPHKILDNVFNDKIVLHIPKEAHYLSILLIEPDPEKDSDDDLDMSPILLYHNSEKYVIDRQELLDFDVFSLDRRLELIFEKYENKRIS